jgi:hypothetical protein
MAATGTCESCGSRGEDLVVVRRLYLTPESWDNAGSIREADFELWCFPCRTMYPHQEPGEYDPAELPPGMEA